MRYKIGMRGAVWLLAGAVLLTVAGTTLVHSKQAKQAALNGQFAKTQILVQSVPLLQALLLGATTVDTVICPSTTFDNTGQPVHHWNIDSTDPRSGDMAHLLWNADTGELITATQVRHQKALSALTGSSAQAEPTGLSWDWFHAMKISRPTEKWHIVGTQKKRFSNWDICFRSGDRYAILTIKSTTGQLVLARCGHLPSANMDWAPFKDLSRHHPHAPRFARVHSLLQ